MTINTTGQLRRFLADLLTKIQDGSIDIEKARTITKTAAQINESFYSEIKVAKIRADAGEEMVALGKLEIGDGSQPIDAA